MQWYIFDEGRRRQPAPDFRLPSSQGDRVALSDYRGDCNLVLFFAHDLEFAASQSLLRAFAQRRADYRAEAAQVLAVLPASPAATVDLPFPVLSDPRRETLAAYAALLPDDLRDGPMVFVIDRYGAPYAAVVGADPADPGLHAELLEWLSFIELQCPE